MSRHLLHSRRLRLPVAVVVAAMVAAALALAQSGSAGATVTTLKTFTTPGTYAWTVPTGVTNATFDVFGARGGSVVSVNHSIVTLISQGGAGGEAKAKFKVHGGEVFEIVVGGQGGTASVGLTQGAAGSNGGGSGGPLYGGGGGGGSDVRIGGRGNAACVTTMTCGFGDRIIAAGGGGGGANNSIETDGDSGGGLTGCCFPPGANFAIDATQERGGYSLVAPSGVFGVGSSAPVNTGQLGAGGGGGWYGGSEAGNGGGGSGYISPLSLSGSFSGGLNQGDGKVIITTTT